MAEMEYKKLAKAKENTDEVNKAIKRLKSYGWVVANTSTETSENNQIDYITLQRDLSIEENVKFKEIEDEEDEVNRAVDYCNLYEYFLDREIDRIDNDRGFRKAFLIFLIIYAAFQIIGGTIFALMLGPMLESGFISNQGSGSVDTTTQEYVFPEGMTLFGQSRLDLFWLVFIVCNAVGFLILIVALLILLAKRTQRKILLEQREAYKDRRDDFALLKSNLKKWKPESLGKFDPYEKGNFKSLK